MKPRYGYMLTDFVMILLIVTPITAKLGLLAGALTGLAALVWNFIGFFQGLTSPRR